MSVKRAPLITVATTLALAASGVWAAAAPAAVVGTEDANDLAAAVTGAPSSGATLTAASFLDTGFYPAAVADAPLGGFPTAGSTFSVLTSGDATLADTPNSGEGDGENLDFNIAERGSANDPLILAIPVNVPANNNCLAIDYKFFSEEFPEYVNAGFNDTLLIELDQTTWVVNGEELSAPNDIAAAKGDRVSVDTVGPTSVDPAQSAGTTYDAATGTLTTKTAVAAGPHTLYVSIYDSGDYIFDSAVFVDNARSFVEDPATCRPPDIFAGTTGVTVPSGGKLKVKGKAVGIPVTCNLQLGITINCDGTLTLTGSLPKNPRGALAKKQLGKATYSVPPEQSQTVKVKLSGKARKAIKKKGKLKATLSTTNTANGATSTSKVTLKGKKKRKK